ncbi:DUF4097 family beta strand repeat protein [bacterium SCSIO 12696]|nr:DUF4097 family beta strand repeat protein [bacterium SCSIO 12696]
MNKLTTALLSTLLLLLLPVLSTAADREVKKAFTVNPGEQLVVDSERGAINVESHSKDTVIIRVEIEGLDDDEFQVSMDYRNGVVEVVGEMEKKLLNWSWGNRRVRYHLVVPEQFDVDLKTRGGAIDVRDLEGDIEAKTAGGSLGFDGITGNINGKTSGGSIQIADVSGDVTVKTSGGAISAKRIEGDLEARTAGGSIQLAGISGFAEVATSGGGINATGVHAGLNAKTAGGSIKAVFNHQPSADSRLATSAGSVTALIASGVALDIDAKGSRVRSELSLENTTSNRKKSLSGTLNGGGPQLKIRTSAGNVRILKSTAQRQAIKSHSPRRFSGIAL